MRGRNGSIIFAKPLLYIDICASPLPWQAPCARPRAGTGVLDRGHDAGLPGPDLSFCSRMRLRRTTCAASPRQFGSTFSAPASRLTVSARSQRRAEWRFAVIASKKRIAGTTAPCLPCCRIQDEESARHQTRKANTDADL